MKKRFLFSAFAACGLSLSAFATPAQVQNNFKQAINEVDAGGEYICYGDLTYTHDIFTKKFPSLIRKVAKNTQYASLINQATNSILKLINFKAFKAVAYSSIEQAPGVFVTKAFLLADMHRNSILIDNTAVNSTLDLGALPADTRIAFKGHLNLARAWSMIYKEVKFNPNPQIRNLAKELDREINNSGIDVHAVMASINGEVEILLAGTGPQDVSAKVVIPDANGSITEQLKKILNNRTMIPLGTNTGIFVNIVYGNGKITAVTNRKLLRRPMHSLASREDFRVYAAQLPKQVSEYLIVDIPQELIDLGRAMAEQEGGEKVGKAFDHLQPISVIVVGETKANGIKSVAVSNFSFYQLPMQLLVKGAEIASEFADFAE